MKKQNTPPAKPEKARIGQATEQQIVAWKSKHPEGIYAIQFEDRVAYFREPSLTDFNAASAEVGIDNQWDYYINLAKDTFLGGDGDMLTKGSLQKDLIVTIRAKADGKIGELVNL